MMWLTGTLVVIGVLVVTMALIGGTVVERRNVTTGGDKGVHGPNFWLMSGLYVMVIFVVVIGVLLVLSWRAAMLGCR